MPLGAPAASAARLIMPAAFFVHSAAAGCGANTIAFRDFNATIALKITVDVGLVEGIIPKTSPTGSATSRVPLVVSSAIIPTVFSSLISSYSNVPAA